MTAIELNRSHSGSVLGKFLATLVSRVSEWRDMRATRRALSRLSDRELADIGLTRSDIDWVAQGQ